MGTVRKVTSWFRRVSATIDDEPTGHIPDPENMTLEDIARCIERAQAGIAAAKTELDKANEEYRSLVLSFEAECTRRQLFKPEAAYKFEE